MSTGSGCLPFILAEDTLIWPIWEWTLFYHHSFDVLNIFIDCGQELPKNAFSINLQLSFCADQSTKLSSGFALYVSSLQHPAASCTSKPHFSCNLSQIANIKGGKNKQKEIGKLDEKAGETNKLLMARPVLCYLFSNAFPLGTRLIFSHFSCFHPRWLCSKRTARHLSLHRGCWAIRGQRGICAHNQTRLRVSLTESRCIASTCRAPVFLSEAAAVGGSGYQQLDWPHPCVHAAPV